MFKKILFILVAGSFAVTTVSAQSFHAEFSYTSFRPFINFQLELGSGYHDYVSPYESSYLKGYMDGVNATRYADYRFYDLVYDIEAYEAGYRDGYRDQQLYCRLHGYNSIPRRPFTYNDYYSPYFSVQIWLSQLSFTFISAPDYRLPRHWSRRAHPRAKQYRARFHYNKRYVDRYKKHHRSRLNHLKKRAQYERKQYRKENRNYRNHTRNREYERIKPDRERIRNRSRQMRGRSHSVENSRNYRNQSVRDKRDRSMRNKAKSDQRIKRSRTNDRPKVRVRNHSGNDRKVMPKRSHKSEVKRKQDNRRKRKVRSRSRSGTSKVKGKRNGRSESKKRRGGSRPKRGDGDN